MKIRPVGAELSMRKGRRTDMNLTVAFRKFANAPKIRTASRYSEQKVRDLLYSGTRTMRKSYRAFYPLVTVARPLFQYKRPEREADRHPPLATQLRLR
jgi:hypothetical protein